jgi:YHS domain-containing protein
LKKFNNILIDYIKNITVPVDPVCGIEMDESLAVAHEHEGKKYYFCCNGCRRIFIKKPKKYKNKS